MEDKRLYKGEDIPDLVGSFGPWQLRVFIITFFINAIAIWHNYLITFMAIDTEFSCVSPAKNECFDNSSLLLNYEFRNSSLLMDEESGNSSLLLNYEFGNSSLLMDEASGNSALLLDEESGNSSLLLNYEFGSSTNLTENNQCSVKVFMNESSSCSDINNVKNVPCNKWAYNSTRESIITEWNLVCDNAWKVSFAKSTYMIGYTTATLVFGQFSDYYGRYLTMVVAYSIMLVSSLLSPFSVSYLMYIILRFFMALGRASLSTTSRVILLELIGSKNRAQFIMATYYGMAFGFCTLPAVVWVTPNGFWLQLSVALPVIPLVCIFWLVPESPRWLLSQKKYRECTKILTKGAKINGKEFNVDSAFPLFEQQDSNNKKKTLIHVFRIAKIRNLFFITIVFWIANMFTYFAITYNVRNIGGTIYLTFFFFGISDILTVSFGIYALHVFRRKPLMQCSYFITSALFAVMMFLPNDIALITVLFSVMGKFCVTSCGLLANIYTMELFPTEVRNSVVGASYTIGRTSAIFAPFLTELATSTHRVVPDAVRAGILLLAAILTFRLPETKNRKLADTLEEAKEDLEMTVVAKA